MRIHQRKKQELQQEHQSYEPYRKECIYVVIGGSVSSMLGGRLLHTNKGSKLTFKSFEYIRKSR